MVPNKMTGVFVCLFLVLSLSSAFPTADQSCACVKLDLCPSGNQERTSRSSSCKDPNHVCCPLGQTGPALLGSSKPDATLVNPVESAVVSGPTKANALSGTGQAPRPKRQSSYVYNVIWGQDGNPSVSSWEFPARNPSSSWGMGGGQSVSVDFNPVSSWGMGGGQSGGLNPVMNWGSGGGQAGDFGNNPFGSWGMGGGQSGGLNPVMNWGSGGGQTGDFGNNPFGSWGMGGGQRTDNNPFGSWGMGGGQSGGLNPVMNWGSGGQGGDFNNPFSSWGSMGRGQGGDLNPISGWQSTGTKGQRMDPNGATFWV